MEPTSPTPSLRLSPYPGRTAVGGCASSQAPLAYVLRGEEVEGCSLDADDLARRRQVLIQGSVVIPATASEVEGAGRGKARPELVSGGFRVASRQKDGRETRGASGG